MKAGRREWIGLAVLALPCLLYSMDLTVLHLAIPKLTVDLEPSSAELLWIIDIYGFLVAGSLITMGTLGDRIGRRKILLIGAAAFGVASVAAALSTTAAMLITTRALLGLAGATIAPSTLSLIRSMFLDERQRTQCLGVVGTLGDRGLGGRQRFVGRAAAQRLENGILQLGHGTAGMGEPAIVSVAPACAAALARRGRQALRDPRFRVAVHVRIQQEAAMAAVRI